MNNFINDGRRSLKLTAKQINGTCPLGNKKFCLVQAPVIGLILSSRRKVPSYFTVVRTALVQLNTPSNLCLSAVYQHLSVYPFQRPVYQRCFHAINANQITATFH